VCSFIFFLEQIKRRNCADVQTLNKQRQVTQPAEEDKVMPALLWVVFWSSLMATAACFGEMSRVVSLDKHDGDIVPDP
jgi:hypothetical protein